MTAEILAEVLRAPVRLLGYRPAREVADHVGRLTYLHSGPPVDFDRPLPAPLVGGLIAGLLFEREADTADQALAMVADRQVRLLPCQDGNVAWPLTGIVTPNTPMVVVERSDGQLFCAPMHEGDLGGMRTGMFDAANLERLRHIAQVIAPAMDLAVSTSEPISPFDLQVSALRRGDECHNRNVSATLALLLALTPSLNRLPEEQIKPVLDYFTRTTQHFISVSAAVAKSIANRIEHEPGLRGLVTAVGMNGQDFGIKVSGLDGWFRAASPVGPMVAVEGADIARASAGQGDSPIIETIGLGAFSLSCAPTLARTFGYSMKQAIDLVDEMRTIAAGSSPIFELANEDFTRPPAGIDVGRVASSGTAPATTLGFLSRDLGQGRVGAGVIRMPLDPFITAATALSASAAG